MTPRSKSNTNTAAIPATKKPARATKAKAKVDKSVVETPPAVVDEDAPPANAGTSGPQIIDGFLHFSALDLARYELAQAKVLNSLQAIGLKRAEMDSARRALEDMLRQRHGELDYITQASVRAENEFRALQAELQTSYKVDLSKVTYDDVTGKITVQQEEDNAKE